MIALGAQAIQNVKQMNQQVNAKLTEIQLTSLILLDDADGRIKIPFITASYSKDQEILRRVVDEDVSLLRPIFVFTPEFTLLNLCNQLRNHEYAKRHPVKAAYIVYLAFYGVPRLQIAKYFKISVSLVRALCIIAERYK